MTEDEWAATDHGRAVTNFVKFTLTLGMVIVGGELVLQP
jgi:hypothetical protein